MRKSEVQMSQLNTAFHCAHFGNRQNVNFELLLLWVVYLTTKLALFHKNTFQIFETTICVGENTNYMLLREFGKEVCPRSISYAKVVFNYFHRICTLLYR